MGPLELADRFWPEVKFADYQVEIIESVWNNTLTLVPAANMMGKDFVSGFIAVAGFLLHKEVRIVTTSVRDDHLRVLWGEIGRFIQTCKVQLVAGEAGEGPKNLIVRHNDIRKYRHVGTPQQRMCKISYLTGIVSEKGEGLAGHHAPWTLAILDEASGIDKTVFDQVQTWAKHILAIGNPNPSATWFKDLVKAGDLPVQVVA